MSSPSLLKFFVIVVIVAGCVSLFEDQLFVSKQNKASMRLPSHSINASQKTTNMWPDSPINETKKVSSNIMADSSLDNVVVSIFVRVEGKDLGVDVAHLAFASILQSRAKERNGISTNLVFISNNDKNNSQNQLGCFPNLPVYSYMNNLEFMARQHNQRKWLADKATLLEPNMELLEDGLDFLVQQRTKSSRNTSLFMLADYSLSLDDAISVEELLSLRNVLALNQSCCPAQTTITDEDVVLFLDGHHDLSPDQIATLGTKVAIAARHAGQQPRSGVRVIPEMESPMNLYCLLRTTIAAELVGPAESELFQWAALFNPSATKRRIYGSQERTFAKDDPRSSLEYFHVQANASKVLPPIWNKTLDIENISLVLKDALAMVNDSFPINLVNASTEPTTVANKTSAKANEVAFSINTTSNITQLPLGTKDHPVTIVTQLSGELCNNLCKLAYGYGLKWWLEDDYGIYSRVVLKHQNHGKWTRGRDSIEKCFPNLRGSNFEEGNSAEMDIVAKLQSEWLGDEKDNLSTEHYGNAAADVTDLLDSLKSALTKPDRPSVSPDHNFTIPFILSETFATFGAIVDRYYEQLRELFSFDVDKPECCQQRAAADESVFHLRNFLIEMPRRGYRMGFEELSANKTANELFGHLQAGDKVAITSRFTDSRSDPYVDALRARGIAARIIKDQNAEQDFCYLLSAQKEMVGTAKSTFAVWASYLGNATVTKLYSVKSPAITTRYGGDGWIIRYNFTNQLLSKKFEFPFYSSEAQDAEELTWVRALRRYQ
jgi:hypothetical protein